MPQKEQKRKQNDKLRYIIKKQKKSRKKKKSFTKVQVINQKLYYNKTVRKPEKLNNKAKK